MKAWIPHVLPFFLFGLMTYAGPLFDLSPAIVYPLKTVLVAVLLVLFFRRWSDEIHIRFDLLDIAAGLVVFAVWILLDPYYPRAESPGFNPNAFAAGGGLAILISFRLIGAVLVVPVMEELFWRSFAMRYLVNSDFRNVPLGTFSWFSFAVTAIAFGLEHHRWLPGIIAGGIYGLLLVRSRNLFSPIVSHAVTNLALGIYVLKTESWLFW